MSQGPAHIAESQALFLVALDDSDPEKQAARAHTRQCAACTKLWDESLTVLAMLDAELARTPANVSPELAARVQAVVAPAGPSRTARFRPLRSVWWLGGALVSVCLAALDAEPVLDLEPALGLRCVRFELAFAAAALLAGFAWARATKGALDPLRVSVFGMSGALLGQMLLRTRCEAPHAALHLLAFHVLGVMLASLLGAGVGRWLARTR